MRQRLSILLALVALAFITAPAMSQVITVRSGEHYGFTRLVLTFPEPAGWDFGRTAYGYGLRVAIPGVRYDLSTVYQAIGHDRLSALWVDPETGVLRLGLGCACHAIAEPFRRGIVTIDLFDGPPPADSPFEPGFDAPGLQLPALRRTAARRPLPRPRDFIPLPKPVEAWFLATRHQSSLRPEPLLPASPALQRMSTALSAQIDQAIAAGIITLTPGQPSSPDRSPSTAPAQIRLINPAGATGAGGCVPAEWLDIAAWSRGPSAAAIAAGRGTIFGEFDRPDPGRIRDLARIWIHHGFGTEAHQLIRLWGKGDPQAPILEEIGLLIDGWPASGVFTGQHVCNGPAALWAVLAAPRGQALTGTDIDAVFQAYSALPDHLRRAIGLTLHDHFDTIGDKVTANRIGNAMRRGSITDDWESTLIAARDRPTDDDASADQVLSAAAHHNRDAAPHALAALVTSQLRRGDKPDEAALAALEALHHEYRNTAEAPVTRRALAQALAATGAHARAFAEFAGLDRQLPTLLWRVMLDHASDAALVETVLTSDQAAITALPANLRLQIARRLLGAGFPNLIDRWLTTDDTESILLQAQAALDQYDSPTALRLLAGRSDPAAERLKAQALESLANHKAAHEKWQEIGDETAALRALILARDWANPALGTALGIGSLLAEMTAASVGADLPTAPLQAGRVLLDNGTQLRAAIDVALAAYPLPEPSD